ncbi:heparan-alpha-glucosaminide N-acetyltransferase domain-containing protein [Pseudonocardia nantongensis]|uniref:heparan-alpha-glucosaminide N-acetyltransferase domain-containing protein n=1 Tax=Pseudonocardia nantongensis TaxID=1181885 RepID=UPI0039797244
MAHAAAPSPTRPGRAGATARPRLAGVDAARGIALLGMIAAHALLVTDDSGAPNGTYLVVGGRAAALFAVLAGVAIAFMTGRRRAATAPDRRAAAAVLGVRAAALLLVGLVLGWTDSDVAAVILPFYALLFLIAIPLVRLPSRWLAGTALAVALVVPVLSQAVRPLLPEPSGENPSFGMLVSDPGGLLTELLLTGVYPALPWTAYLAAGIAIGRLPMDRSRTATRLLGGGAALAAGATAVSALLLGPLGGLARIAAVTPVGDRDAPGILDHVIISPSGTTPTTTWWWLTAAAPHSSTPLDLLATIGSSAAVLGAMLLVCRSAAVTRLLTPLAGAGAMTLTLYTASIVFMNTIDDFDPVPGFALQVVVALIAGLVWRAAGWRGPLEAVLSGGARGARERARG